MAKVAAAQKFPNPTRKQTGGAQERCAPPVCFTPQKRCARTMRTFFGPSLGFGNISGGRRYVGAIFLLKLIETFGTKTT